MLLVKLYSADDKDSTNVIQTFPYGDHIIGRGPTLKCFDKRVSRRHAILKIKESSVTLTPVHINPCFYIPNGGSCVVILPKDTPKTIVAGDRFALLPDQFWYRVTIEPYNDIKQENPVAGVSLAKKDETISKSPQLTQISINNAASVPNSRVSLGNGTIIPSSSAQETNITNTRVSLGNDTTIPSTSAQETNITNSRVSLGNDTAIPSTSTQEIAITNDTKLEENTGTIKQQATDMKVVTEDMSSDKAGASSVLLIENKTDLPSVIQENSDETSQSLLGNNVPSTSFVDLKLKEVSSDGRKQSNKRSPSEDICTLSAKQTKIEDKVDDGETDKNNVNTDHEMVEIKNSEEDSQLNLILIESGSEETNKGSVDKEADGQQQNGELVEDENSVKIEIEDNELSNQDSDDKPAKNELNEDRKEDPAALSTSNEAGPSSKETGTSTKKQKRERCWYGASCYRKHPSHKSELSHPGDDDYSSDSQDDRPTCSYGAACYRRNAQHRQQYKHPGPPAPRPNAGGQRRRASRRVNYNENNLAGDIDDDYDYNDPFIDDGSSDEYVESGYSGSDTDEEYSQSQDGEDLKRLLREANKFTSK